MPAIDDRALAQLFESARSQHNFTAQPVERATLERLYELVKMGPTAFNAQPARLVFVTSDEARRRLAQSVLSSNREKVQGAPVTAIVGWDSRFHEHLPEQFPAFDAKALFDGNPQLTHETAFRNASMQGGYLIIAARSLGLAAGPMSGFDPEAVNAAFFPDGRYRVNFLVNLGYPAGEAAYPRGPRLSFDEAVQII